MRMLDVSRVRSSFANVVEGVSGRAEVVVIVRYGKPLAAIVPMERLTREEKAALGPKRAAAAAVAVRRKPAG